MREVILTTHLYAALSFGPFILILGVTGSLMVFTEEIDRALNPRFFTVATVKNPLPVAEIRRMLPSHQPGLQKVALRLPQRPGDTYVAQFQGKHYFVNPYDGELAGVRDDQTPLSRINKLHTTLWLGDVGAAAVHVSSIVLLFLVVSGVYLWLPYRRWRIALTTTLRRAAFDTHLSLGILTFVLIGILAVTGIVLSFEHAVRQSLMAIAKSTPPNRNVRSQPQLGARPLSEDEAIAAAATALPGAKPLSVQSPANATASFIVAMRYPEDRTPIGRSWVTIDQYSGRPLAFQSSRTAALSARALIIARALHTGDIYGIPSRIVMLAARLVVALQMITGCYLWWKKFRPAPRGNSKHAGAKA